MVRRRLEIDSAVLVSDTGKKLVSPVDGSEITVAITGMKGTSVNDKTGAMAQVHIMLANIHPVEANRNGSDRAICGDCSLRRHGDVTDDNVLTEEKLNEKMRELGKVIRHFRVKDDVTREVKCYVTWGKSVTAIYRSQPNKNVITFEEAGKLCRKYNTSIRLGAAGDPAMIPIENWESLIETARTGVTGYTHQWDQDWFDTKQFRYSMASVDPSDTPIDPKREIMCPSATITCDECRLCGGEARRGAKSIVELAHGNNMKTKRKEVQ